MGYHAAIEDGIKIDKSNYDTYYYPECCLCGAEVKSLNYIRGLKYKCEECKAKLKTADKKHQDENNYKKKETAFKNAKKIIEKNCALRKRSIKKYQHAFEVVYGKLHRHGWFDSKEEIIAAIELVKHKIKARHQVKMGIYKIDFVLPDEKVVLEIDGRIFHTENTRDKESLRDGLIIANLGPGWEVIRITDDLINANPFQVVNAIKKVKSKRAELREKHGGLLPDDYSRQAI